MDPRRSGCQQKRAVRLFKVSAEEEVAGYDEIGIAAERQRAYCSPESIS